MEYENYFAKIFFQQEPRDLKVRAIPEKRENQAYSMGKEESCENLCNLVVIKGAKQILIMHTFVGLGLYDEEVITLKGL